MPKREGSVAGHRTRVVLALSGELDAANATEAHKRLLGLPLHPGSRLVLDLRELTFMDSTGIRLILRAGQFARTRGAGMVVVRPQVQVMRVLELVGLDDQLDFVDRP